MCTDNEALSLLQYLASQSNKDVNDNQIKSIVKERFGLNVVSIKPVSLSQMTNSLTSQEDYFAKANIQTLYFGQLDLIVPVGTSADNKSGKVQIVNSFDKKETQATANLIEVDGLAENVGMKTIPFYFDQIFFEKLTVVHNASTDMETSINFVGYELIVN